MINNYKIGNIVYFSKEIMVTDIPNPELYNVLNYNTEKHMINYDKPVLYIGYYNFIEHINNKIDLNILVNKISDKVYWCFSKEEKMLNYFAILSSFKGHCIEFYSNHYLYKPFNNLFFENEKFNILDFLKEIKIEKIYYNNRSIFFYYDRNKILGIDMFYINYVEPNLFKTIKQSFLNKTNNNDFILIEDKKNVILQYFKENIPDYYDVIEKYIGLFLEYEQKSLE